MLPVGALCFYQAHFGRTVLPKWPFWAHLFYAALLSSLSLGSWLHALWSLGKLSQNQKHLLIRKQKISWFFKKRAEYCFESTFSEERTHWARRKTRWVLQKTRWLAFGTRTMGWAELTELSPRKSVRAKKLTELGVWNLTLRSRIRPVSDSCYLPFYPINFRLEFQET